MVFGLTGSDTTPCALKFSLKTWNVVEDIESNNLNIETARTGDPINLYKLTYILIRLIIGVLEGIEVSSLK